MLNPAPSSRMFNARNIFYIFFTIFLYRLALLDGTNLNGYFNEVIYFDRVVMFILGLYHFMAAILNRHRLNPYSYKFFTNESLQTD